MFTRNNTPAIDRYNELKSSGQTDSVEFLSLKTQAWKIFLSEWPCICECTWQSNQMDNAQLEEQSDDEED